MLHGIRAVNAETLNWNFGPAHGMEMIIEIGAEGTGKVVVAPLITCRQMVIIREVGERGV